MVWQHDAQKVFSILFITFRMSRRSREMYIGHARLCVCVSVCLSPNSHTTARTRMQLTWGFPLFVHYWADLQSVHGFTLQMRIAQNAKC